MRNDVFDLLFLLLIFRFYRISRTVRSGSNIFSCTVVLTCSALLLENKENTQTEHLMAPAPTLCLVSFVFCE